MNVHNSPDHFLMIGETRLKRRRGDPKAELKEEDYEVVNDDGRIIVAMKFEISRKMLWVDVCNQSLTLLSAMSL